MTTATMVPIPKGRIRCPWLGVPIPRSRPLVLATETVRAALKGVVVTDAALIETARGNHNEPVRALEVTFVHGKHGHGRSGFYDLGPCDLSIHNWAEKQRERLAKNGNGLSAKARRIGVMVRRLEKEKKSLYLRVPLHPLLPTGYRYTGDHCRESEWRWHSEKAQRKSLARIAGQVLKHKATATTGYRLLREGGFGFTKFSDLRRWDRDRVHDDQRDYWKHLHFFVHGMLASVARAKDYVHDADEGDEFQRHKRALLGYLADKRQAESIDAQIVALRQLAA